MSAVFWALAVPASETVWAAQETVTYESPVFTGSGDQLRPAETMERGGKQYRLISVRIKDAVGGGILTYASAGIPYMMEGRQEPPETARITLEDELSGEEYEREVPLQEIREKEAFWSDDFHFSVTVSGYDADSFLVGDTEIPAGADLAAYGNELLDYLGLPRDCYHVEKVNWSGESYEKEGALCRDAQAEGSKLVRNVEAIYGGQVRTPEIEGKQYIGIYEEIISEPEGSEETLSEETKTGEQPAEAAEARYPALLPASEVRPDGPLEKIIYWLRDHLTVVTVSGGFLLLLLAAGLLLWLSGKKERKLS